MGLSSENIHDTVTSDVGEPRSGGILVRRNGRRADVVLNDPDRHNPQSPAIWFELARIAAELEDQVDVVVLSGAGPSFSAGLDRRAFTPEGIPGQPGLFQLALGPAAEADAAIASYQEGFACWRRASFLTIAAVAGHAIGAGFQLALAADIRIAADDVQFAMREPQLGLVPDLTGTATLVEAVGYARALEICATAATVTADQALSWGLVSRVVPRADLDAAVDTLVNAVLSVNAGAVKATRALLRDAGTRTAQEQHTAERQAQIQRLAVMVAAAASR